MAHIIDTTTYEVLANILVDTRPRVAKFTHDGKQVWVSAEVGGTIAVIDAATAKIVKKIRFHIPGVRPELIQPMGIIFSKDGKLRLRRHRPRQPHRRDRHRHLRGRRTTFSSGSGRGTWRYRPTAPSSTRRTGLRTT